MKIRDPEYNNFDPAFIFENACNPEHVQVLIKVSKSLGLHFSYKML